MDSVALRRDDIGLLPSGDGSADRFLLHTIQDKMHCLGNCAIGSVRECQDAVLNSGIIKGTGEGKLHNRHREVLHTAVAVGIHDLQLDGVTTGREVFAHVGCHHTLGHIQNRLDHTAHLDGKRTIAGRESVLNGAPFDRQSAGCAGCDGAAHPAGGIGDRKHRIIGGTASTAASTRAAKPGERTGDHFSVGGQIEGIVLHIAAVHLGAEDSFHRFIARLHFIDRVLHSSHFIHGGIGLLDCQGCGGIRFGLDVGNFLSGFGDGLHGGILGAIHFFNRSGSGILHAFNGCVLRSVDLLLCSIYHTGGILLHASSGILDAFDLGSTFILECLDRSFCGAVHRIVEAGHRLNRSILCGNRIFLCLGSGLGILLCTGRSIFSTLGKLGHLLLGLLGNLECFNDAVRICEDFLNLLDLRLGFQGVIVQSSTLYFQIEVGAGQAVFRGAACGSKHQLKGVLTGNGGHLLGHLRCNGRHRVDNLKGTRSRDAVAIQLGAANLGRHTGFRDGQRTLAGIQLENQQHIGIVLRQMDGERNAARHHIQFIGSSKHSRPSLLSREQRP